MLEGLKSGAEVLGGEGQVGQDRDVGWTETGWTGGQMGKGAT